jgi:hypothetical protein
MGGEEHKRNVSKCGCRRQKGRAAMSQGGSSNKNIADFAALYLLHQDKFSIREIFPSFLAYTECFESLFVKSIGIIKSSGS